MNMKMNEKKTKSMIITKKEDKPNIDMTIYGTKIEQVTHFPYLEQKMIKDGRCEEVLGLSGADTAHCYEKLHSILVSQLQHVARSHGYHALLLVQYIIEIDCTKYGSQSRPPRLVCSSQQPGANVRNS